MKPQVTVTTSNSVSVSTTINMSTTRTPQFRHPRIVAGLEWLCDRLNHVGACAILNGRFYVGRHRLPVPGLKRLNEWTHGLDWVEIRSGGPAS